jgi:hypothetical protein
MNKFVPTLLLFFIFFLFSHNTFAEDMWLKGNATSRNFIIIDTDEDQIQVKVFHQKKGDYQDKIAAYPFRTLDDARSFIQQKFPDYISIQELQSWPVSAAVGKKTGDLWTATNEWNEAWEKKYADWLKSEITEDFYMKYNISTDCADALIGYRWIFARIYSLPVANTVSSTGSLFGHFSMRNKWKDLTTSRAGAWYEDQLFLRALNYVMDMTSTRTVMNTDGFPVSITRKGLQAGTFIVSQTNGSGHMRTITQNYYDDPNSLPIFTFSSTAPREVRPLYKEAFIDQAWPIRKTREIMAFRWPVVSRNSWVLKPKESDPRYSQEQFDSGLQGKYYSFVQFVLSRVHPDYDPNSLVTTGVTDIVNYTNIRIKIVRDGYAYCRNHDCRQGTQAWEDWSTPNRDAKYLLKYNEVEDLVRTFDPMYPGLYANWSESLNSTIVDVEGHPLSLTKLRSLFERKLISSNPSDPILKRWGL